MERMKQRTPLETQMVNNENKTQPRSMGASSLLESLKLIIVASLALTILQMVSTKVTATEKKQEDQASSPIDENVASEQKTALVRTVTSGDKASFVSNVTQVKEVKIQQKIDEALKKLFNEPSLHKLKQAALLLADADVEGATNWMRSTNLSAILPVIKLTAEHDMERDESLDRYQDEPDRWGADTDRDLGFQVSAQWNLGELVFNPDEVRVYNALASRAARRESIVTLLISYYFERRRLIVEEYIFPLADKSKTIERKIRIQELTAIIDALTGGLLLRTLKQSN